tara:strand:+ start:368 stop:1273 length:906 start_codon:yes stop_codon:yes gene_type:complete
MSNLYKTIIALPLVFVLGIAQTETDAIEKARQAKEAAEKAAAEAAAATEAAIEQAAQRAASEARTEAKRKKEEEEARRLAEEQAAEEAELDAAAAKAAEEAKRKMAAELGLEYEEPTNTDKQKELTNDEPEETVAEEVVANESSGYNLGFSGSLGFIQGNFFENIPTGGSLVLTTPWGFDLGGLRLGLSATLGAYPAKHNSGESFTPLALGVGGNLTLAEFIFTEGHLGLVGDAMGARGFAGVSLERLMKKGLDLPFNVLIGAEGFLSTLMKEGVGSVNDDGTGGSGTYWGGFAFRIDYNL